MGWPERGPGVSDLIANCGAKLFPAKFDDKRKRKGHEGCKAGRREGSGPRGVSFCSTQLTGAAEKISPLRCHFPWRAATTRLPRFTAHAGSGLHIIMR